MTAAHGLGRRRAFDERSLAYGVAAIEDRPPRPYTWAGSPNVLDQGREGECVGFGWAAEVGARPVVVPVSDLTGRYYFQRARSIDREEGRHWGEGASVLAGAKAVQRAGRIEGYLWAFGVEQLASAVSWRGPVVVGTDWYQDMHSPDQQGYVRPAGEVVGGHAYLVRGYSPRRRRFVVRNSWGPRWGVGGDCYVSTEDMEFLLARGGEACVPVGRRR